MRKAWIILSAVVAAGPAWAQVPAASSALRPGEVLLQISATGEDRRAADDIVAKVAVRANGATAADARAALDGKVGEVTAALAKAGIGRDAISIGTATSAGPGAPVVRVPTPGAPVPASPKAFANETLTVKLANEAKLQAVRSIVASQDVTLSGTPNLALRDDRAAREAATADAFAKATQAAQLEASLIGMHVVRPIRVSNYGPIGDMDLLTQPLVQMMQMQRGDEKSVTTTARVYIDFAMSPGK